MNTIVPCMSQFGASRYRKLASWPESCRIIVSLSWVVRGIVCRLKNSTMCRIAICALGQEAVQRKDVGHLVPDLQHDIAAGGAARLGDADRIIEQHFRAADQDLERRQPGEIAQHRRDMRMRHVSASTYCRATWYSASIGTNGSALALRR